MKQACRHILSNLFKLLKQHNYKDFRKNYIAQTLSYKTITLKPGREKSLMNRHPWVFSGAIQSMPDIENGEIVKVVTNKGNFLGWGFFSKKSQITCRVFEFRDLKTDFVNDLNYWKTKIVNAFALRKEYIISSHTNTYRLIHAEGDFFPGLIIDIYDKIAVLQVLIKGTENLIDIIQSALKELGINGIYLKNSSGKNIENVSNNAGWIGSEGEEEIVVVENGIKFKVNIVGGQKTGFFIDQRDNRLLLKSLSNGKRVLNTFSYTGGFSVYALAGGASEVHSVDISADAIKMGDGNVALNFPDAPHKSFAVDCFDFLRNTKEKYDIIVLDPPAFAKNSHAVSQAAKGYKDINLQAIKNIKPGGLIFTFSCSQHIDRDLFRKIVFGASADAGREVRVLYQLNQPADHPVNIYHPEGEYLKGLVLKVS